MTSGTVQEELEMLCNKYIDAVCSYTNLMAKSNEIDMKIKDILSSYEGHTCADITQCKQCSKQDKKALNSLYSQHISITYPIAGLKKTMEDIRCKIGVIVTRDIEESLKPLAR